MHFLQFARPANGEFRLSDILQEQTINPAKMRCQMCPGQPNETDFRAVNTYTLPSTTRYFAFELGSFIEGAHALQGEQIRMMGKLIDFDFDAVHSFPMFANEPMRFVACIRHTSASALSGHFYTSYRHDLHGWIDVDCLQYSSARHSDLSTDNIDFMIFERIL